MIMMRALPLLFAGLILALPACLAVAQPYPTGLSDAAQAKFESYDNKIAAAIRESESKAIPPRELITRFPKEYAINVLRETFGSDWAPIKEYADAALAELQYLDPPKQLASEPVEIFVEVGKAQVKLTEALAKASPFEEGLATARTWDPRVVANAGAMMVLGKTSAEKVAYHTVASGFLSQRLFRSRWRDEDALVLYQGTWIFAMNYIRTPRGLIIATNIGMYRR